MKNLVFVSSQCADQASEIYIPLIFFAIIYFHSFVIDFLFNISLIITHHYECPKQKYATNAKKDFFSNETRVAINISIERKRSRES